MPQVVLALVKDIIFSSKIRATAQALGVSVQIVREPDNLHGQAGDRVLVDLNQPGALEAAVLWRATTGGQVVGFVSHVDKPTIDRASAAGIDKILPRSAFVQQLTELVR